MKVVVIYSAAMIRQELHNSLGCSVSSMGFWVSSDTGVALFVYPVIK